LVRGYTDWRGIRDTELSKVSGIPGCIFVHASGFIGGNSSYEGNYSSVHMCSLYLPIVYEPICWLLCCTGALAMAVGSLAARDASATTPAAAADGETATKKARTDAAAAAVTTA
jgi:hypothetical protein